MCGIVGMWGKDGIDIDVFKQMQNTLQHRGPDDDGLFLDERANLALGHQRLAIIDTSAGGHQPMVHGNLVATYNGEIYNFQEIRSELERTGVRFTTGSDTEVLLAAFQQWGKASLHRFRGMFAFAIWNKKNRKLTLCRDRAGVKPLYFYHDNGLFIFASEIRGIIKHPHVKKEINPEALAMFLQRGYVPAPASIFKGVYKLEAACILEIDASGNMEKEYYWDIADIFKRGRAREMYDEEVTAKELERVLAGAFNLRMVSDVPVGIFLSGGIDSSLVAALLQRNTEKRINTFTIGFEEDSHNEAHHAKRVADHIGTNHHELYLTADRAKDIIPVLPRIFDEPFGDPSAIPAHLVSKFAREEIKVALSADGGDELFGGYRRYRRVEKSYEKTAKLDTQLPVRALSRIEKSTWGSSLLDQSFKGRLFRARGDIAATYANFKNAFTATEINSLLARSMGGTSSIGHHFTDFADIQGLAIVSQLQIIDFKTYLPDDVLTKVDRASMSVGLESREPFLDPEIMECAGVIPDEFKHKDGKNKYILRKILYKHVPEELVDRPKKGFGVPIGQWLKSDLSYLLDEYLNKDRICREGIFNAAFVDREKREFLSGKRHYKRIWNLLMFQIWQEYWGI